jgi:glycosyltransferase involved in cell wall biosynthesis
MKKIVIITGEDMLDVDLPIVKELNASNSAQFKITWIVVLRGYGWFKKDQMISFCEENKIDHIILEQIGKLKNPLMIVFYIKLLNILKKLDPDIIYDSFLGVPYMHFFRPFFLKRKLFVIPIHDVVQHSNRDNLFVRTIYDNFLISQYSNFHIFSDHQLRVFKENHIGKNTFCSPLFLKDFGKPNTVEVIKSKETTTFLFFGIIRPNKGLDILIKAANALGKKYSNFHIVVAGKCDDWETYDNLIERPELFTLKIANIEKEEVPSLLTNTHFLVLPYRDVTQSGVLLSAYNYNTPAIASKLEWFEEYIEDGINGYLFENENVEDLSKKMEIAINLDISQYERLVDNLKTFIAGSINIKDITQEYVKFFESIN